MRLQSPARAQAVGRRIGSESRVLEKCGEGPQNQNVASRCSVQKAARLPIT